MVERGNLERKGGNMTEQQRKQEKESKAYEQRERLIQSSYQTVQQGQDKLQPALQDKEQKQEKEQSKEKDYGLYGWQGFTAKEVEILYKMIMEREQKVEREQKAFEQDKGLSPQEKYRALQEQNKKQISKLEQDRQNKEKGGKER